MNYTEQMKELVNKEIKKRGLKNVDELISQLSDDNFLDDLDNHNFCVFRELVGLKERARKQKEQKQYSEHKVILIVKNEVQRLEDEINNKIKNGFFPRFESYSVVVFEHIVLYSILMETNDN